MHLLGLGMGNGIDMVGHSSGETIALATQRHNAVRAPLTIPNSLARFHDAAGDHRVMDKLPRPHLLQQLLLRDEALAMCDQVRQHLEDFGLQRHHVSFAVQLMCLGVQSTHAKAIDHGLATYGIKTIPCKI